jgi:hypothetical protein
VISPVNSAPGRDLGYGRFDVVANQPYLVMLAGRPGLASAVIRGRMHAEFGGPGLEDEPAAVRVNVRPAENIAEEHARRFRVAGVDERRSVRLIFSARIPAFLRTLRN